MNGRPRRRAALQGRSRPPAEAARLAHGGTWLVSRRLWISDTIVSKSSASALLMSQWMRASCAVGLRNMPKVPLTRFANPLCSLFSLAVRLALIAIRGGSPQNARQPAHRHRRSSRSCFAPYRQRFSRPPGPRGSSCPREVQPGRMRARRDVHRGLPSRLLDLGPAVGPLATSWRRRQPRGAGFIDDQPSKGERLIQGCAHGFKSMRLSAVARGTHRQANELQTCVRLRLLFWLSTNAL